MYQIGIPDIFAGFLATQDIGLAIKGLDGRYLYANPGYGRLLGAQADVTVTGSQDADMLPESMTRAMEEAQRSSEATRVAVNIELQPRAADAGAGAVRVTHFPVFDAEGGLDAVGVLVVPQAGRVQETDEAAQALRSAEQVNAQLASAVRSLQELASTDGLTKAWNRRRFEEALEGETHRAIRFGHPLSLAVIDIDHFKSVNDNFGHPVGDRILAEFADCLREGMRKSDSLTRWGGEEFIILMPNTPLPAAQRSAERLREQVEQCQFRGVGALTASIGVAQFAPTETTAEWLRRADDALYRAKKRGRNLVEVDTSRTGAPEAEHIEGNFVRLVWKQRFCSGHPLIDAQHRVLFEDANHLLEAVLSGRPADEVELLIERLIEDVARHFRDEEQVLSKVGFADREGHAQEHAALLARARSMATDFRAGTLSGGELFQYLAYDLVARHMLGSDRQFFPSIGARRD
jgi:diguanylate cyclase (GGDEF)-like protein/hemerythrin-like metal-binding protein